MHLSKILTLQTINQNVVKAQYAVRGELAIRAEQLRTQLLQQPNHQLPFTKIINCNIGNPQQLNQQPITYLRQIASLLEYPALLDIKNEQSVLTLFPKDAVVRARTLSNEIGSVGAYSHSMGIPSIRANVARFIEQRDGYASDMEKIFLTSGASSGVQMLMQTVISNPNVGIMIPIPQYPLYTATIGLCNGTAVPYYLNEETGWSVNVDEIKLAVIKARNEGVDVRALCVINPGNPTGNLLSIREMQDLVMLCVNEKLVLMADEVYQANIWSSNTEWTSFKKIVRQMDVPLELVSFHSISKGMIGECGRRGGYFELVNIDEGVCDQLYKLASISLCPNVSGQIGVDVMVNPPKPGSESFDLYQTELTHLFESLKRRAKKLYNEFNTLEGVNCQLAQGALYLHPQIQIPQKAVLKAQSLGQSPDTFYCLAMLNQTGVCMVPGIGFLQKQGTFHFRCTFLPPEEEMDAFILLIKKFHREFMQTYRS